MRSKRQQYHDGYSNCRTQAEKTTTTELCALWLTVAESYELLLDYEEKYPTEKSDGLHSSREAAQQI